MQPRSVSGDDTSLPVYLSCVFQLAGRPLVALATETVSHDEVLVIGREKAEVMKGLVQRVVELLDI